MVYCDPDAVDKIISFASSLCESAFISYSMIKPDDRFGQMMIQNFKSFGAPLKSINAYKTSKSYQDRFLKFGFKCSEAYDLNKAMDLLYRSDFKNRLRQIEIQDDPEELAFMLAHYVLAVASSKADFLQFYKFES